MTTLQRSPTDGFWLQSLRKPNVELVRIGIDRVVPDGIITDDGVHRPANGTCCATGFRHNEFLAPMTVVGRDQASPREQWGHEPTALTRGAHAAEVRRGTHDEFAASLSPWPIDQYCELTKVLDPDDYDLR